MKWARKDIELRDNFSTQTALGAALCLDGQLSEAAAQIKRALSSGVQDVYIFSQAASIYRARRENAEAELFQQLATALNPYHQNFHVHR